MTIVCAYTDGVSTWLGSDTHSCANEGYSIRPLLTCPNGKWAQAHGWAFGHVGDSFASMLIATNRNWLFEDLNPDTIQKQFSERLRQIYGDSGMKAHFAAGDAVGNWQNSGILARAGAIWDVDGPLAVNRVPDRRVMCRGCATGWATGAAWAVQRHIPGALPPELIHTALTAAAEFDMQICGYWQGELKAKA